MNDIKWHSYRDLGCIPEGEYLVEVDRGSTKEIVFVEIIHAYYCKAADVFAEINCSPEDDGDLIYRDDIVRWVHYQPPNVSDIFDQEESEDE
jgi:hypothetical protein